MDDYSINSLTDSKNEWCSRLVAIITPHIIQGIKSIFNEAWKLCEENVQKDKYLMTFQTFLTRIPQWNETIITKEKLRICEKSSCSYLEELISCVHIIHLKALTCVRVCHKQKKIDINIPTLNNFIHKIYINVARKIYTNIYLFEKNIAPLEIQKRNRELECIIKECILDTIRDSIPVEMILRSYIDETNDTETEVSETVEEIIEETPLPADDETNITMHINENNADTINSTAPEAAITKPVIYDDDNDEESDMNTGDNNENDIKSINNQHQHLIIKKDGHDATINDATINDATTNDATTNDATTNDATTNDKLNYGSNITFSDIDMSMDTKGKENQTIAPKSIERLEELSNEKTIQAKLQNINEDDSDNEESDSLTIGDNIDLDINDINDIDVRSSKPFKLKEENIIIDDIEFVTP
jgi:hypothetical protein